jgi:hypothetical protein
LSTHGLGKVSLLSVLIVAINIDGFTLRKGENVVNGLVKEFGTEFGHFGCLEDTNDFRVAMGRDWIL